MTNQVFYGGVMYHYRNQTVDLTFSPFIYEHQLRLSDTERPLLQDLSLGLSGYATFGLTGRPHHAPNDLHLYIDGIDITESLIIELRKLLDAQPDQAVLVSAYRIGMDKFVELAEALGSAFGQDLDALRAKRDELAATPSLSSHLQKLGDIRVGAYGMLHLINYLWTYIELPLLSLFQVIETHNSQHGQRIDVSTANHLIVSSGPCRLFTHDWTPPNIFGAVRIQYEAKYHNPLWDEVQELKKRMDALEKEVRDSFETIKTMVGPDGPLARTIRAANSKANEAILASEELSGRTTSLEAQLSGLQATSVALTDAVRNL